MRRYGTTRDEDDTKKTIAPCESASVIPDALRTVVTAVVQHSDKTKDDKVTNEYKDELRTSCFADKLPQVDDPKAVSMDPKDWIVKEKDPEDGSERVMTDNLWMNLSDGHIGSGRRQYGGTGGCNGALNHYNAMLALGKNYPLVVKLGTINANGADVYSYDKTENDMVLDPHLRAHLTHFGLDMDRMSKTDKSMAELELDQNLKLDLSRVTEDGEECKRVFGPGLVGLKNLGNSCYMNSLVQCLMSIPEIREKYRGDRAAAIIKK